MNDLNQDGCDMLAARFMYCACILFALVSLIPSNLASATVSYYESISAIGGAALKDQLHELIDNDRTYSYKQVWNILKDVDQDPNNPANVLTFYHTRSVPKSELTSQTNNGSNTWNREHLWPVSFGFPSKSDVPHNDVHHIRAEDASINNDRGNYSFGSVYDGTEHGEARGNYYNSYRRTWEPSPDRKGDVARALFYMIVRYEGDDHKEPNLEYRSNIPFNGSILELIQWHLDDPVSQEEQIRNSKVFRWQGNRNPFIDYPHWVEAIWGSEEIPVIEAPAPELVRTLALFIDKSDEEAFAAFISNSSLSDNLGKIKYQASLRFRDYKQGLEAQKTFQETLEQESGESFASPEDARAWLRDLVLIHLPNALEP